MELIIMLIIAVSCTGIIIYGILWCIDKEMKHDYAKDRYNLLIGTKLSYEEYRANLRHLRCQIVVQDEDYFIDIHNNTELVDFKYKNEVLATFFRDDIAPRIKDNLGKYIYLHKYKRIRLKGIYG